MSAGGVEAEIVVVAFQGDTGCAPINGPVVLLEQTRTLGQFGGDPGEVSGLALGRHDRLA